MQVLHGRTDIAGSNHVLFMLDTQLGYISMEHVRQQTAKHVHCNKEICVKKNKIIYQGISLEQQCCNEAGNNLGKI